MNAAIGWSLAVLGVAMGYVQGGWPGVLFAVTLVVFWLLLQFSRVMRVMRTAGAGPVGHVDSAVMLHSKLKSGMRLLEILPLTRSLGQKVADDPETFVWTDDSGAAVRIELLNGRCRAWRLERPQAPPAGP